MFFKLHSEKKIWYKELTKADLWQGFWNQTHIGLFGDLLTFLPNKDYEDNWMFLYNKTSESLTFSFDRIWRKNWDFNSPKIKTWWRNTISIVSTIREIALKEKEKRWFLVWFWLESEEVVFFAFNDDSSEYRDLKDIINIEKKDIKGRVVEDDVNFNDLMIYLEGYVNKNNINKITALEVLSQSPNNNILKEYRFYDIIKANRLFSETWKNWEILIDDYFNKLKSQGKIFNYTWYNKDKESWLPYDFTLQENSQNVVYIDVKSTMYKFEQPLIFSNQEIDFITSTPNYSIYRVFDLSEESIPKLKVCDNGKTLAGNITPIVWEFKRSLLSQDTTLQVAKIAIKPTNLHLRFDKEIPLTL